MIKGKIESKGLAPGWLGLYRLFMFPVTVISCDPMGLPAYGDIVNIAIFRAYCTRDIVVHKFAQEEPKLCSEVLTS